jgi:prepilin-type N-terminal cleavage/methylation domain-containing protein
MLKNKMRSRKGFTLVELLVVIVIIAILVAIALPRYWQAINDAKLSTCKSNLKQIDLACQAYYGGKGERDWTNVTWDNLTSTANADDIFKGGVPVCPFNVDYALEQELDGTTVIGVHAKYSDHFTAPADGQWFDATEHAAAAAAPAAP